MSFEILYFTHATNTSILSHRTTSSTCSFVHSVIRNGLVAVLTTRWFHRKYWNSRRILKLKELSFGLFPLIPQNLTIQWLI